MVLIEGICNSGLRSRAPGMVALVCFPEKKVGILHSHSCRSGPFAETVEVFGKEVNLVLPLMENSVIKIFILRTVAVGGVRRSGAKSAVAPLLDIVSLYGIKLVAVFDIGINVCKS